MNVRWLTACVLALVCFRVNADEIVLRAVSGFNPGTTFSVNFEAFIKRVNERGKGAVQIHYVGGGGKVMDPFQMGNALKTGVVDVANLPGTFYTNVVPEADALKLIPGSVSKLKGTEVYALLDEVHNRKGNAHLLARQKTLVPFHLYVNKKIAGMDLTGLKLRTTPIYAPFFTAMGATVVRLAPGDIYTALERGVVDGYGWPLQGIFDLGWQDATKFRVDPGFYNAADEILVNLSKWNGLTGPQKAILEEAGAWMERTADADDLELNRKEAERQSKQGIQVITLVGEQREKYSRLADETAWKAVISAAPEYGPKLKRAAGKP